MKNQYRVTKYNPSQRDATGAFAGCNWTSRSDIGKVFNGKTLSEAVYRHVENSYLSVIKSFLEEARIKSMALKGLERRDAPADGFLDGANLSVAAWLDFARIVLREEAWGKLVVPGKAYIHIGQDYYMYIGVPSKCEQSILIAGKLGLFVERFRSPYLRQQPMRAGTR